MTAVIDYGVGNLFSLCGSLAHLGVESTVTADPAIIQAADHIILPGVGAFGDAYQRLTESGLIPCVKERVASGVPLLGICLGMQLLFDRSHEYGVHAGLGLIHGEVCPLRDDLKGPVKVPHMGWNSLQIRKSSPLFRYIEEGEYVYYVHSFYAKHCDESILATSRYGGVEVTGAVSSGNVFGTQFHPEKSGETGLKILKAFLEI
jgi:glutamine amidotransferase